MSDYQDLCESYGRSASDPEFIDDLIDELSGDYFEESDWFWENENKEHYELLVQQLGSVDEILASNIPDQAQFSLLVMLHAHIVSAIEGYLAGVFIHNVCNSDPLTRKLVETDPDLSKRKLSLGEIYHAKDTLAITVSAYLKDLIFHKISKVKPMFEAVLGHRFNDLSWLFAAIEIRHDCVHRAGHDKEGERVNISAASVRELSRNAVELAIEIEATIDRLNELDL